MDQIFAEPNECPLPENSGGDSQIVELLLREKILTEEQVEYASRVLSKIETPRPILEILKELNFVDDDQISHLDAATLFSLGHPYNLPESPMVRTLSTAGMADYIDNHRSPFR